MGKLKIHMQKNQPGSLSYIQKLIQNVPITDEHASILIEIHLTRQYEWYYLWIHNEYFLYEMIWLCFTDFL